MPDFIKDSKVNVQILSLHKVLEGLIHNINTPLNLILGYTQQLQKQYPEIKNLSKIYDAGLAIDDIIQSCARNIIKRFGRDKTIFDLNQALIDEIMLCNDVLEIKHKIILNVVTPENDVLVNSNPCLFSLFIDSLILYLSKIVHSSDSNIININLTNQGLGKIVMNIQYPALESDDIMDTYLAELQAELEQYSGMVFTHEYPFYWKKQQSEILIYFSEGKE